MEWFFRDISDDPSEKELTQQDQFNNDEVALAEALVRETIQNSTDARLSDQVPVRVRFALGEPASDAARNLFHEVLVGLTPHLDACGIAAPSGSQVLIVEDFETTGLKGAIDRKDDGQFCGFWRRFGRSNKRGSSGGRWGLGKLVFSSSSSIKTLIGLTRRADTPQSCLMGQAILKNHEVGGLERDSVGFWCAPGEKRGQPATEPSRCEEFARTVGLQRTTETGLSLVIPYVLPDIEAEHLIAAVLKNYYFPILTGRLIVTVNDITINAGTFDQVSAALGKEAIPQSLLSFVRQLQSLRAATPTLVLPAEWQSTAVTGDLLGDDATANLRERYRAGEMLAIRAPLRVRPKSEVGQERETHVDLFLRPTLPGERSQTLVVRGSITVPTEGKKSHLLDCNAALVAQEERISQLLGDAENPAHTQWNERAEKLRANWDRPHLVLRRIRAVLGEIHSVIADRIERDDPNALVDFFSIPKPREPGRNRETTVPLPLRSEGPTKPFRILPRQGGFSLVANSRSPTDAFPVRLKLRCAYDVLNGNPFRRFSDLDFSFYGVRLTVEKHDLDFWPTAANEASVNLRAADSKLVITGFDTNRDLVVEAQAETQFAATQV